MMPQGPEEPSANEITLSIKATLENSASKTYLTHDSEGYHANWNKDDLLGIAIDNAYGSRKTFTNQSEDGAEANFTGSVSVTAGTHTLSGFYPKDITCNRSDASFEFTIPVTQTLPSLNSFDKTADLLIAKPVSVTIDDTSLTSVDMPFRRAACILKVIPEDNTTDGLLNGLKLKSVSITSASDIISGRSLKCYIDGSKEDEFVPDKGSKTVTANYNGNDFEIDGTNAAFIIVTPEKMSAGVSLTIDIITDNDAVTIHKIVTPSNDIALNAGKVKPLRVKLNDSDVEIQSEPSLTLNVSSDLNKDVNGGTFTIEGAYSLINCNDSDVTISADGDLINPANVSISNGNVTYSLAVNETGNSLNGWIGLNLAGQEPQIISVTQTGGTSVTYSWSFTDSDVMSSAWSGAGDYTWRSDTEGQIINYGYSKDQIVQYPSGSGIYCMKTTGDAKPTATSATRVFTYNAPGAGTLKIGGYKQTTNSGALTVTLDGNIVNANSNSSNEFSSITDLSICTYEIGGPGTIVFYTAKKSYFASVQFTCSGN